MLNIKKALKKERLLSAITGVREKEFNQMLNVFAPIVSRIQYKRARQRQAGAGRKHTLTSVEEKLFYILFYMKCYPTYDLAGFIYDVDKSQANRWVTTLLSSLEKALGKNLSLPKRKISTMKEFLEQFPEVKEIIIDGTERPIQRPQKQDKQKQHYSGKKKRHTHKNIVVVDAKKKVLVLTPTSPGKEHDYNLLKKSNLAATIPKKIKTLVDLGFKGIDKDYSLQAILPHRKPRITDLTKKQKADNIKFSARRVKVENALAGIKRLRCITDVCRTRLEKWRDKFMFLACGLWNFHLKVA